MSELERLLNLDPLHEAEKITGESYKCSEETSRLGLGIAMMVNQAKRDALTKNKDTHMSSTLAEYLLVVDDLGFELVNKVEFFNESNNVPESQYWYWQPEKHILLMFSTYTWEHKKGNPGISGGHFYYCHEHDKPEHFMGYSSGGYVNWKDESRDYTWFGHHDCREGLRYHIENLAANGTFKPWPKNHDSFIWPFHFGDEKQQEHLEWSQRFKNREDVLKERASKIYHLIRPE